MLRWLFGRYDLISLFAALCCATPSYSVNRISESQHPSHFILLIDASGSTRASKSRRDRYRAVLLQQVLPQLCAGTLSAGMPPFDPQQDLVSVFHFGAVEHSVKRALKGLAVVDFVRSEVHPIRIAVAGANREEIGGWLLPNDTYQYTFLTLAKALVINALPADAGARRINRTYLALVTDGLPNHGSLDAERAMIRRWGDPHEVDRALAVVAHIESTYRITLLQQPVRLDALPGLAAFVLEAYEVSPTDWSPYLQDLTSKELLEGLAARWTQESGPTPEGVITGYMRTPNSSGFLFVDVHAAAGMVLGRSPQPLVPVRTPGFSVPFRLNGPLLCDRQQIPILLRGAVEFSDPRLGLRRADYEERLSLAGPLPFHCVVQRTIRIVGFGTAVVGVLFVYFILHRRIRIPSEIARPVPKEVKPGVSQDLASPFAEEPVDIAEDVSPDIRTVPPPVPEDSPTLGLEIDRTGATAPADVQPTSQGELAPLVARPEVNVLIQALTAGKGPDLEIDEIDGVVADLVERFELSIGGAADLQSLSVLLSSDEKLDVLRIYLDPSTEHHLNDLSPDDKARLRKLGAIALMKLAQARQSAFRSLCRDILNGLGMAHFAPFEATGVEQAFRISLVRKSGDGMFSTKEDWLCTFASGALDREQVEQLIHAAVAADVHHFLLILFGSRSTDMEIRLREALAKENIRVAVLADDFAHALARDYSKVTLRKSQPNLTRISFAHLRSNLQRQSESAPWRRRYQTASIQPTRVLPLSTRDAALTEADLFRALDGGSFLLLGEPGAGKTTSLVSVAGDLATAGPYTPVFVPLGRYRGDFWSLLCEALAPNLEPLSKTVAEHFVSSGVLVLLLDGFNEVQDPNLQGKLVAELNGLTRPTEPTANSCWIVTSRVYDYQWAHQPLIHLESRRWEMQPLTADLIYRFLADELGESSGLELYRDLGPALQQICANPLLLNMVLTVRHETGNAPSGKADLYHQFIDLLLGWGVPCNTATGELEAFCNLFPAPLTHKEYYEIAQHALTALATSMSTTMMPWGDAHEQLALVLTEAHAPERAATWLLQDLTRRGILRLDAFNRVSFFHHTFQEYFQARQLIHRSIDDLIPRTGVPPAKREEVIFVAGLVPDPSPLIRAVMDVDLPLACELLAGGRRVPDNLTRSLVGRVWERVQSGHGSIGRNRRFAILFKRLADRLGNSVDEFTIDLDKTLSEGARAERLMVFYSELGDHEAERRILAQATKGEDIPDDFLFRAALSSQHSGAHTKALELYTRYLEHHPDDPAALNNRGLCYSALGQASGAFQDFERAVAVRGNASERVNLAAALMERGREMDAREQLRIALERDPQNAVAHAELSQLLEEEPEAALTHLQHAIQYAPHDEEAREYYSRLADLQEILKRYAGAIKSLRQMIGLSPTSPHVRLWKERIARLRQSLDVEERTRSARQRLQERGELPLPMLVFEWLRAAGLRINNITSTWLLAEGDVTSIQVALEKAGFLPRGLPLKMPVLFMPDPVLTAEELGIAIKSIPFSLPVASQIIVVAAAEVLSPEAYQSPTLPEEYSLAPVTALEVRDALLQGDEECRLLLDRVLGLGSAALTKSG